jgi:hypothetical protein
MNDEEERERRRKGEENTLNPYSLQIFTLSVHEKVKLTDTIE